MKKTLPPPIRRQSFAQFIGATPRASKLPGLTGVENRSEMEEDLMAAITIIQEQFKQEMATLEERMVMRLQGEREKLGLAQVALTESLRSEIGLSKTYVA